MYQESDDRISGGKKLDLLLFVLLLVGFFLIGGVATYLRSAFDSPLPIYIFVAVIAVMLYVIYRVRILGYRYTVFYKEPEPEYDPRFDDYMIHEDYPYPIGTIVIERTVSAKGTIVEKFSISEVKAFLKPDEDYSADEELICCSHGRKKAHSLIVERGGKTLRIYIHPSDELAGIITDMLAA